MDVIFDTKAADELLRQMDNYCSGVVKETRDLLNIVKDDSGWRDEQKKEFQRNIDKLAHDLNDALQIEGEYMRIFHQRVMELREG